MIGFSTLSNLFNNVIATGIVNRIYHSVMLKPIDGGGNKPAAPVEGRWKYVGFDDTDGFSCYCRQTGSADVQGFNRVGGCNKKIYRFQVPCKLVLFSDFEERSHDDLIAKISGAVMKTPFINIQKIITNPDEILRSEAPTGKLTFKENTLFCSIDFFLLVDLQSDNCEEEIQCEKIPNPYCVPGEPLGCTRIDWSTNFGTQPGSAPDFAFIIYKNGEAVVSEQTPGQASGTIQVNEGDEIELYMGHSGNFAIYGYSISDNTGVIDSSGGSQGYVDASFTIACANGPYTITGSI